MLALGSILFKYTSTQLTCQRQDNSLHYLMTRVQRTTGPQAPPSRSYHWISFQMQPASQVLTRISTHHLVMSAVGQCWTPYLYKRMLDPVLIGSLVTGSLAIISQAVSKCKCHVACKRDVTGEICTPSCQCGFLDIPLTQIEKTSDQCKDETRTTSD